MHAPTSPDRTHPNGHAHSPATPPAEGERDAHGRFGKGNRGGPGNPFARQVAALRSALLAALTPQDIKAVAQELLRQAKDGNLAAARLLLSYALGKPAAAVDPDTLDLHEFGLYRAQPDPTAEMAAAGRRVGLPFALKYLRVALPGFSDAQERMMAEGIADQVDQEQRQAAAREKRRARRQEPQAAKATAAPSGALTPDAAKMLEVLADDPEALAALLPLFGAAGGPATPCQAVPPPSANGVPRRRRPGG